MKTWIGVFVQVKLYWSTSIQYHMAVDNSKKTWHPINEFNKSYEYVLLIRPIYITLNMTNKSQMQKTSSYMVLHQSGSFVKDSVLQLCVDLTMKREKFYETQQWSRWWWSDNSLVPRGHCCLTPFLRKSACFSLLTYSTLNINVMN